MQITDSFNGAGVFRPRKLHKEYRSHAGQASFNGAGVFRPRKCRPSKWRRESQEWLQWGRGLSTPEIRTTPLAPLKGGTASMGPGSFDPGNQLLQRNLNQAYPGFNGAGVFRPRKCRRQRNRPGAAAPLQWGRGLSTPEISKDNRTDRNAAPLQWGRGLSTPEMAGKRNAKGELGTLQWGRGLSTPEMRLRRHALATLS